MLFKAMLFKATLFKAMIFKAKFDTALITLLLFLGLAALCSAPAVGGPYAAAQTGASQESWQKEFDEICAQTEDAMTFSQAELADLIRRCDNLKPRIEKSDESRRKVYLERLRKCRGLYAYVLDAKKLDAQKLDAQKLDAQKLDAQKKEKK